MKLWPDPRFLFASTALLVWGIATTAWAEDEPSDSTATTSADSSSASSQDSSTEPTQKTKKKRGGKASAQATVDSKDAGSGGPSNTSVAALVGYGFSRATHFGFGLRGGMLIDPGLYVGGQASYFLGSKETNDDVAGETSYSQHLLLITGEVGVDVHALEWLTVRPYMGLGAAVLTAEDCDNRGGCDSDHTVYMTLSPGATGLTPLGAGFFAGLDLRYQVMLSGSNASAAILSATLGYEF